jgi:hypothetical protein
MKKTYLTPKTTVVTVEPVQMIASSVKMYNQDATGAAMGRQGRGNEFWDEDKE